MMRTRHGWVTTKQEARKALQRAVRDVEEADSLLRERRQITQEMHSERFRDNFAELILLAYRGRKK